MKERFSRRQLLKVMAASVGGAGLIKLLGVPFPQGTAQELDEYVYLPIIQGSGRDTVITPPTNSRVVHVHNEDATNWSGQTDYWNYVDQTAVNGMVDQGMMALTGAATVAEAWQTILPNYQAGQSIAIKANFNNSTTCTDADGVIDGLIHPVNGVVRGLKQMGVAEADIWVYDASRRIPDHFVNGNLYSNVRFFDKACRGIVTWSSSDPNAYITFSPPAGVPMPPATRLDDLLINASYLINMPIMKPHGIAGVTLTFKNHFGDISNPWNLHDYIGLTWTYYRSDYNPLIDIYLNPHVGNKTVLVVGDGLMAAKQFDAAPATWSTFGNEVPNSLFFATDPVAVDCVMCDLLAAEVTLPDAADDYLALAEGAGLGVYERGAPWGTGYNEIDYLKIELGTG
jgi:hypothetical protein